MNKQSVPAAGTEGWFDAAASQAALLGARCTTCGAVIFPPGAGFCHSPDCSSTSFETVRLPRTGVVWAATDVQYQPPPPFVPRHVSHHSFAIAAVTLDGNGIVILGQVVDGVRAEDLFAGSAVELVFDTLFEDEDTCYLTWKWKPFIA